MESASNDKTDETTNNVVKPSDFDKIADVSLQFESEWTIERSFTIEDALALAPERESLRRELFERLLEIDMTRGFESNVAIPNEEYVRRFPRWKRIVESVAQDIARDVQNVPSSRIGKQIGDYRIDEEIGQGGTGRVYKAFDRSFKRPVAVKFLKNADERNEERLELFKRELVAMGQIPHDSIFAQAYSCGLDDGVAYLAMEFVDGVDLQRYFQNADGRREKDGSLDWREATDYVAQIASGLLTIHELGIAHRDVKPANVMLDSQGKIRVLDLGFAGFYSSSQDEESAGSKSKTIAGTRAFLAPEARNGQNALDAQADLYSLGGTYLYLLTGIAPSDWFDPLSKKTPKPLVKFLREKNVKLPAAVVAILSRLLEPNREKRYQNAREVCKDLNALLAPPKLSTLKAVAFVLVGVFLTSTGLVAYQASGANDLKLLNQARKAAAQKNWLRVYTITDDVRAKRLSTSNQIDFFMLRARGCNEAHDFDGTRAAVPAFFKALSSISENPPIREFDVRASELQALVLSGLDVFEKDVEEIRNVVREANEKFETFFEKYAELDEESKREVNHSVAAAYYWRACMRRELGRERNDINPVLDDLKRCLEYEPDFRNARKLYGTLLNKKERLTPLTDFQDAVLIEASNEPIDRDATVV